MERGIFKPRSNRTIERISLNQGVIELWIEVSLNHGIVELWIGDSNQGVIELVLFSLVDGFSFV